MTAPAPTPLSATAAAIDAAERLVVRHGPLVLFQSGGCCDGSLPICVRADELPIGAGDLRLGEVGGVPFYVDREQYERWRRPAFLLDVRPGAPEGFSLGPPEGHFVTAAPPAGVRT